MKRESFLIVSSYELLSVCQASIVGKTLYKKIILEFIGENGKDIKLRNNMFSVVLVVADWLSKGTKRRPIT